MIKDYFVHIPPHLFDVLQDISGSTSEDFETVINASRAQLFNFTYPVPTDDKEALEKFIMNRFILRRIGSGNVRKWRQLFKGKMLEIMPFYARLLESEHLTFDPLINNDITTTDDATGTLDTTRDKRTDNDDSYSKNGTNNTDEETTENSETNTTKSGTHSGQYSKSGNESANSTELNRYSDTPQGDSGRIWEVDGQGNPRLTDYYITDVRGITNNGSRNWSESGNDSGTTSETGKVTDEKTGTRDTDVTWTETGGDQRDIVEHEVIDTDTTNTNENVKIGVAGSSKSKLVNEYRETFLRLYTDIAGELEPLFYNLVEVDDIIDFV